MNDFYSRKPISSRRLVGYGFVAAVGVAALGFWVDDNLLYIAAPACGLVVGGFGFLLSWMPSHVRPVPGANGQAAHYPAWVWWIYVVGLLGSTALKIWDIHQRK